MTSEGRRVRDPQCCAGGLLGFALILSAQAVRAHDGAAAPLPAWQPNLWLLALLGAASLCFALGFVRRARHARSIPHRRQACAFVLCIATLALALVSPLDRLSDLTFSAHMTQHELLMVLAAPLLVLARPLDTYVWLLTPGARRALQGEPNRRLRALAAFLTAPLFALLIHGLVRWLWHLPWLFEAALRDEWTHGVQHATFFLSALLFWWGVVEGRYGRSGYGLASLFVLVTALHSGALGALLALGTSPWYPLYTWRARGLALDPLADQQLAGLVMWVGAGMWLMLIALALFLAWLGEARRRVARAELASLLRASGEGVES
jgi:putative membrane protein